MAFEWPSVGFVGGGDGGVGDGEYDAELSSVSGEPAEELLLSGYIFAIRPSASSLLAFGGSGVSLRISFLFLDTGADTTTQ